MVPPAATLRVRASRLKSNLVFGALGSLPFRAVALAAMRGRVRVLCYHRIHDPVMFGAQLEHLTRAFVPVTADQFCVALQHRSPLPDRAVWVTFDDGHPSVIELAQPILDAFGVKATLFICPGLIEGDEPFWWDIVEAAAERGFCERLALERLKTAPDRARRARVAELGTRLRDDGWVASQPVQPGVERLRSWLAAGHSIGNHTWDHPCLDRCDDEEQVRQIRRAHEWVRDHFSVEASLFAYPNSNWTATAEATVAGMRYAGAVLLDDRLASLGGNPYRISRLQTLAESSAARFRATVSGAHSLVFTANRRTPAAA